MTVNRIAHYVAIAGVTGLLGLSCAFIVGSIMNVDKETLLMLARWNVISAVAVFGGVAVELATDK